MILRKLFVLCFIVVIATTSASALVNPSAWATEQVMAAAPLTSPSLASLQATESITRAEFCDIAMNLYDRVTQQAATRTSTSYFIDCFDENVNTAYELGLVTGRGNGLFDPNEPISRQDLCVMLQNIANLTGQSLESMEQNIYEYIDSGVVREYAAAAVSSMLESGIIYGVTTTMPSGNTAVLLDPTGTATREQALIMANRFYQQCDVAQTQVSQPTTPDLPSISTDNDWFFSISDIVKTNAEKMVFLFGESAQRYTDQQTALDNMSYLTIDVWTRNSAGQTVAAKRTIQVHTKLVPIFDALFAEIFASDERIPIKDIGGWAWRSNERSEHRQGTAIDINWDENMECSIDADGNITQITCGTLWEPYVNPYSIPADSDMVAIFKKYGFTWGGDGWTSKRDYMHFSFLGT